MQRRRRDREVGEATHGGLHDGDARRRRAQRRRHRRRLRTAVVRELGDEKRAFAGFGGAIRVTRIIGVGHVRHFEMCGPRDVGRAHQRIRHDDARAGVAIDRRAARCRSRWRIRNVRISAGESAPLADFSSAAIAAACGAAAEVPKNVDGNVPAPVTLTPSAAVMSGFCRSSPPVDDTFRGDGRAVGLVEQTPWPVRAEALDRVERAERMGKRAVPRASPQRRMPRQPRRARESHPRSRSGGAPRSR